MILTIYTQSNKKRQWFHCQAIKPPWFKRASSVPSPPPPPTHTQKQLFSQGQMSMFFRLGKIKITSSVTKNKMSRSLPKNKMTSSLAKNCKQKIEVCLIVGCRTKSDFTGLTVTVRENLQVFTRTQGNISSDTIDDKFKMHTCAYRPSIL